MLDLKSPEKKYKKVGQYEKTKFNNIRNKEQRRLPPQRHRKYFQQIKSLVYIYYNCVTGFFVGEQRECVPDSFYAFENLSPYWIDLFSFDIRVFD